MRKRREYDDDDGRQIADMSGVERPNLLTVRTPPKAEKADDAEQPSAKPEWENPAASMPKEDRRAFIWGALSASLLIGLAFLVGIGLVILLITLLPK